MISKYKKIVILVFFVSLCNIILLIYRPYEMSCLLFIVQNILIPFLATPTILVNNRVPSSRWVLSGLRIGALLSLLPTTSSVIVAMINYYFQGDRALLYVIDRQNLPTDTISLLVGLIVFSLVWVAFLIIGSLCGLLGAVQKRPINDFPENES